VNKSKEMSNTNINICSTEMSKPQITTSPIQHRGIN